MTIEKSNKLSIWKVLREKWKRGAGPEAEEKEQAELKPKTRQSIHQKTVKDRYGLPIRIGSKVAFNCSGEVCIGFIKAIKTSKRYGRNEDWGGEPYYNFFICHQNSDDVSVVKSRKCVTNVK